jgi:hypothetical protein
MNVKFYSKMIVAIAAAVGVTAAALADKSVDAAEYAAISTAWIAVYGVYKVRNVPPAGGDEA